MSGDMLCCCNMFGDTDFIRFLSLLVAHCCSTEHTNNGQNKNRGWRYRCSKDSSDYTGSQTFSGTFCGITYDMAHARRARVQSCSLQIIFTGYVCHKYPCVGVTSEIVYIATLFNNS